MEIVEFDREHIFEVAAIHSSSLPEDFLPSLGSDFLTRIFYPAVLESEAASGWVLNDKDQCMGFVIITSDNSKFLRKVIGIRPFLFFNCLTRYAFTSVNHMRYLLGLLLSLTGGKTDAAIGEIYVIAVDESYRGRGGGKALVNAAISEMTKAGLTGIKIKTLKINQTWIDFFIRQGWEKTDEFSISQKVYVNLQKMF